VRLDQAPPRKSLVARSASPDRAGITSRPMGTGVLYSIDFDFVDHRLVLSSLSGVIASFSLPGQSVADFHGRVLAALKVLDVPPHIRAVPSASPTAPRSPRTTRTPSCDLTTGGPRRSTTVRSCHHMISTNVPDQ
jgi:hypothetical protein